MIKFFALAVAAIVTAATNPTVAENDTCMLIDFTTEDSQFADLNAAIKSTKSAKLIGSVVGNFDPLITNHVTLPDFKLKQYFGASQTVTTTIDSIEITGLTTLSPKHVRVTSPNSVEIATDSTGEVAIDATLTFTMPKTPDFFITAELSFAVKKPTFSFDVEANMFACAPDVSASLCSNITIADLLAKIITVTTKRQYSSIMEDVLMKFKDANVKSFSFDFSTISEYDLEFDSSSFLLRTFFHGASLFKVIPDYSAESINKRGRNYDDFVSVINYHGPTVLNFLIDSMLEPMFGATCLSKN